MLRVYGKHGLNVVNCYVIYCVPEKLWMSRTGMLFILYCISSFLV